MRNSQSDQLQTLKREFDALRNRTRAQADDREARIRYLERTLAGREADLARLGERERELAGRLAALDADPQARRVAELEVRMATLRVKLADAEQEIACLRSAQDRSARQARELELAAAERQAESAALERLLAQTLAEGTECCEDCPNLECARRADLDGRLVLCVGGRLPQVRELGRLVARCNGRFDHHDGGLEDGDRRLEALLASADAVVCATDFVSHSAYRRTKHYCKRHAKPHVLLPRSGLSAFALALERVAQ